MTNTKIGTLVKFLEALQDYPKCVNKVNLRANLTFGTGLRLRNTLLECDFIIVTKQDNRSTELKITSKGLALMELLREIIDID